MAAVAMVDPLERLGDLQHDVEEGGGAHRHDVVAPLLHDGRERNAVHVGEGEGAEALVEGDGLRHAGIVEGLQHLELPVEGLALVGGGIGREQAHEDVVGLTASHPGAGAQVPEPSFWHFHLAHDLERPHTEPDGRHALPRARSGDHSTPSDWAHLQLVAA